MFAKFSTLYFCDVIRHNPCYNFSTPGHHLIFLLNLEDSKSEKKKADFSHTQMGKVAPAPQYKSFQDNKTTLFSDFEYEFLDNFSTFLHIEVNEPVSLRKIKKP